MSATAGLRIECRQARDAVAALLDWLDDAHGIDAASRSLLRCDLNRALVEVPALNRAVDRSPAIAVLAPISPVTNRLMTTLLAPRDPRLLGQFHGSQTRLPVIAGLLPPGDALGVSAIIRLTHDDPAQAASKAADTVGRLMTPGAEGPRRTADSAVHLEILTLADVIMVLGRAYFANVKAQAPTAVAAEITRTLDRTERQDVSPATQPGLAAHHVYEIRGYLEQRFYDHPMLRALAATGYWDAFASLAPRSTSEGRRRLASLIWGGLADFDTVYGELAQAIEALNHTTSIICPPEAVRSGDAAAGWSVAHPQSILAVSTVLSGSAEVSETIAVRSKFGQPVPVSRAVLAALVREAALYVEGDPTAVLATTDILYLPTTCPAVLPRSGTAGDRAGRQSNAEESSWLSQALVQAKTLFLVETTADTFDATGIVVNLDPAAAVSEAFAPVLAQWVERTQGRTPAAREATDTTLFVAVGAHRMGATAPLQDFLRDFSSELDWLEQWGTGRAFDNVFILGSGQRAGTAPEPKRRTATLPVPAGPATAPTAVATLATNAGLGAEGGLWLRHVRDTAVALDEALNTTDGGVRYLSQSIGMIDYQRAKRRQIATRLAELRRSLADAVRRFLLASNPAEDHDWRHRAALATQARLRQVAAQQQLGRLIETLTPPERDLRWLFDRVLADHRRRAEDDGGAQRADRQTTQLAALELLDEDTAARLAGRFGTLVVEHWLHGLRAFGSAAGLAQTYGFNAPTLPHLVDEIVIGAVRLGLSDRIAAAVARGLAVAPGSAELQASRAALLAAELVSAYLSQLGFDAPWSSRHPRRRGTLGAPLFERTAAAGAEGLANVQAGRVTLQYCSDWCEGFTVLTEENIASARGTRFEEVEFRELEELLSLFGVNAREGAL
jgi:hypothetical protein